LQPFGIPEYSWEMVVINYVTDLPKSDLGKKETQHMKDGNHGFI
jgi:hypothetical protein